MAGGDLQNHGLQWVMAGGERRLAAATRNDYDSSIPHSGAAPTVHVIEFNASYQAHKFVEQQLLLVPPRHRSNAAIPALLRAY